MTQQELAFEPAPAPLLVLPAPAALSPEKRQWWREWAERHAQAAHKTIAQYRRIHDKPETEDWMRAALRATIAQYGAKAQMYEQYIDTINQYEGN